MDAGYAIGASIVGFVTLGVMAGVLWFWSRGAAGVAGAGRAAIGFAAAAVATAAFGIFQFVSNPDSFASQESAGAQAPQQATATQAHEGADLREMAARLQGQLQQNPSDGAGWALLARTYRRLQMHREAADAFTKAIALIPQDASLLADYVDSHVMANNGKWEPKDRAAIEKALSIDPKHMKALALAGTEAYNRKDYKASLGYWERMKAAALPDSQEARVAQANITEVQGLLSGRQ